MNAAYMLGRILLSRVFVVAGIQKLMDTAPPPTCWPPPRYRFPTRSCLISVASPNTSIGLSRCRNRAHMRTDGADRTEARWVARLVLTVFTAETIILVHTSGICR